MPLKQVTLCFLRRGDEVLLAMKKRGFGAGKFNDVGGKVEKGESIENAARREAQEEIGVAINDLEKVGTIKFFFPLVPADQNWNQEVHVFFAKNWQGEPAESEEMAPQWFPLNALPFHKMWADDPHWLPRVLQGEKIKAEFTFGENETIADYKIELV